MNLPNTNILKIIAGLCILSGFVLTIIWFGYKVEIILILFSLGVYLFELTKNIDSL